MKLLVVTPTLGSSQYLKDVVCEVGNFPASVEHIMVTPEQNVDRLRILYPNVRIVPERDPGGMYSALNTGLAAAHSEWGWFTYINDDDGVSFDERLEGDFLSYARDEPIAVYGRCKAIDKASRTMFDIVVARNGRHIADLLHWGIVALNQQGLFFSRVAWERIGEFDSSFSHGGDVDAVVRALNSGVEFRYDPRICGRFRVYAQQLSKNSVAMKRDLQRARAKLSVGRKSWFTLLRFRVSGFPTVASRIAKFGIRRTHRIYETHE